VEIVGKKKAPLPLELFCLSIMMLSSALIPVQLSASPTTTVYVYPSAKTVKVGQDFTVEVRISEVIDLYGWEFKLGWAPNLLDVVDVYEGPFLSQGGDTFFAKKINNTAGYILIDCTLLGPVPGVNGTGTLAIVEFQAETQGSCVLDLYDTKLVSSDEYPIPHTVVDGNVTVSESVGGVIVPVSKVELLAHWIGLTSAVMFVLTTIFVFARLRKKKE